MTGDRSAAIATAIVVIIACAAMSGGCGLPSDRAVPTTDVRAETFEIRIQGFGELEAAKATPIEVPVTLRGPQRVAWLIDEGSYVEEGELVARLDREEHERREKLARDAIQRLDHELETKRRELDSERRSVEDQLALLDRERADAERFAPRDDFLFSSHEILDAQVDLELLETRIDHSRARMERYTERAVTEIEILQLQRQTEQVKLTQVEQALGSLEIRAPHAGYFYPDENWRGEKVREGSMVWTGATLGELPDLTQMEAKIHVLESEAAGLEEGLDVVVTLDAYPDLEFAGTVTTVQPVANQINYRSPVKYFEIKVGLETTDESIMKQAGQVEARILVTREEEVLSVPNQAIFHDSEGAWVYVQNGGGFDKRTVTLGKRSPARTVITEGIAAGEWIALTDPDPDATQPEESG